VHLWFATEDGGGRAADAAWPVHVLSSEEIERAERVRFEEDRRRQLLTRIMLRTVLSRYRPVRPEAWTFVADAHGKPRIGNLGTDAGLAFNLSHTRGLIVVAVTASGAVGIDVEMLHRRAIGRWHKVLGPQEQRSLAGLEGDALRERFWEHWTFKEAYAKARGLGRFLPFSQLAFDLETPGRVAFDAAPMLREPAGPWTFAQWHPAPGCLVALCVQGERSHGDFSAWRLDSWRLACRVPVRFTRVSDPRCASSFEAPSMF